MMSGRELESEGEREESETDEGKSLERNYNYLLAYL